MKINITYPEISKTKHNRRRFLKLMKWIFILLAIASIIVNICVGGHLWFPVALMGLFMVWNLVLSIDNLTNNDFYFLEDENYNGNIDKIIIYKWNRDYPADKYFDIDLSSYELISTQDFQGSSHDLITEEIYIKEN